MGTIDIHIGDAGEKCADGSGWVGSGRENTRRKEEKEITWKQFDEGANRCANALIRKGIKRVTKVVHLMMNSIDWLIAISASSARGMVRSL